MDQKDDLIRAVAVVNIKKSDGQKVPHAKNVKAFAREDATEIRKEIEIIKDKKIYAAGEPKKILTAQILGEVFNVKADTFKNSEGNEIIFPLSITKT